MSEDLFRLSSAETSLFPTPKDAVHEAHGECSGYLWGHQRAALEYIAKARRVLLADELGVGKTAPALVTAPLTDGFPVLIVPPAHLRYTWKRAIEEWQNGCSIRIVEPGEPLLMDRNDDPDFFIVSYNLLAMRKDKAATGSNDLVKGLMKIPFKTLICDEAHALKTTTSLRQKAVRKLALGVPNRILIGANPIESKPRELIPQLDILDQLAVFGGKRRFLQRYCNKYGDDVKDPGKWAKWDFSGARNLDELHRKLRSTCLIQRDKDAVHKNLPPISQARVDLPISNWVSYWKAESDFLGWLREASKTVTGSALKALAMIRLTTLKRLVTEGKREAATEWIQSFLDENPKQKLVIFTISRDTAAFFAEKFSAPMIVGGVAIEKREEYIHAFQNEAEPRVIVVGVQAGGTGIELFRASNCVFYDLDWLPTTHAQAAGRLHRPGQKNPVTVWWLLGANTVDGTIFDDVLVPRARIVRDVISGSESEADPRDLLDGLLRLVASASA